MNQNFKESQLNRQYQQIPQGVIKRILKEYEKASHIWILKNQDELATKAYEDLIIELKK